LHVLGNAGCVKFAHLLARGQRRSGVPAMPSQLLPLMLTVLVMLLLPLV
jgi:hypothetical protein